MINKGAVLKNIFPVGLWRDGSTYVDQLLHVVIFCDSLFLKKKFGPPENFFLAFFTFQTIFSRFRPKKNFERIFSSLKLLKSDLRNRLKGDIVDSMIFLRCNKKGLKHSVKNDKKKKAWFEFITYLYFCLNTCLFHNKSFFF